MIKVILIDDEPLARNLVAEYLTEFPEFEIVEQCENGFEAVKAIQKHNPDLLFLDIQMPKINGFETLELLEKRPSVIFTTAFDEYALKAFEQNATDYLLKPFSPERFNQALKKYLTTKNNTTQAETKVTQLLETTGKHHDEGHRIVVKNGTSILILPIQDVVYIEAYDDYVKIFNKETFYLKKKTMGYYEQILNPKQFVRIHRSYLLNINYLTKIEPVDKNTALAVLKSGEKIPLSKTGHAKLREILNL